MKTLTVALAVALLVSSLHAQLLPVDDAWVSRTLQSMTVDKELWHWRAAVRENRGEENCGRTQQIAGSFEIPPAGHRGLRKRRRHVHRRCDGPADQYGTWGFARSKPGRFSRPIDGTRS